MKQGFPMPPRPDGIGALQNADSASVLSPKRQDEKAQDTVLGSMSVIGKEP